MRAAAADLCGGRYNVVVLEGRTEALPLETASLDGASSSR